MGIIIEAEHYRTVFHPAFETLKQKHFPHDPDDHLILHRSEIINRRGLFRILLDPDKEELFNTDFLVFISLHNYYVIAVVIDKKYHREKYGTAAYHPYHFCLVLMLERYAGFLSHEGSTGDVMAESRGRVEDQQLSGAYHNIWNTGTFYRPPSFFQNALSSRKLKLKPKSANIAGVQFADLLAHPIKQDILLEKGRIASLGGVFGPKICTAVRPKYNRHLYQGRIKGYGRIFLG